ncbi:MAG TPA: translation initiation factor IF-2 [Candidatus Paceibacterota bacterium]
MPDKTPKNSNNELIPRPPVVVVMGHIDHGKSTLLDYIRKSNIVAKEAGGITQHLGAYEVLHSKNLITFLDTPGHEAFCSIRERGAKVADIAILVVSAEEGVKPQTIEALNCIKLEKIPFIVAINKIDKPGADAERTKQSLAENEVYVEGYGGDVPAVPISALTGAGIPELLDMIMLVSDIEGLKANSNILSEGVVIEAGLDNRKGIYGTLLIKNGTLESGMYVVAGNAYAPVRILEDFQGKAIKTATFSSPVRVIGWDKLPVVGSSFISFRDKKIAETKAKENEINIKEDNKKSQTIKSEIKDESLNIISIPFIIKADAIGSLEGISHELKKIKNEKIVIKILSLGIGNINEGDVKTAQSNPNIIILSFNTKPDAKAKSILERTPSIRVESFEVIYNLVEFVKNHVTSKIPKEYIEEIKGIAKILAVFSKAKDKQILGGKVQQGSLVVGGDIKILRRDVEIGRGKIKELQQQKVKASEVREGYEFGTLIESKIEIALGDKIQCFQIVEKK